MKRIVTALAGAALLLTLPAATAAQDANDMRDDQLLNAIVQATENSEASDLLGFMQEARNRGLLMFERPGRCEEALPEGGLMENLMSRSPVSWAYRYRVWDIAIENGFCGCPFGLQSFPDFQNEMVGHTKALTAADILVFREYWLERKPAMQQAYRAFKNERCN